MDAQRGYPGDPERWYPGDDYPDVERREGRYVPGFAEEGYRGPAAHGEGRSDLGHHPDLGYDLTDLRRDSMDPRRDGLEGHPQTTRLVGPRSGEPLPPLPGETGAGFGDAPAGRRAGAPGGPTGAHSGTGPGAGVYRTSRPAVAILFGVLAALFELPAIRLMATAAFADQVSGPGVVAATFLIIGLPLFAAGMYALVTGAGRVTDRPGGRSWLRPPVAYLTIALVLFLAAALATG